MSSNVTRQQARPILGRSPLDAVKYNKCHNVPCREILDKTTSSDYVHLHGCLDVMFISFVWRGDP